MSLLLLDTQVLFWASAAAERLPASAFERMADAGNTLAFSVASLWEVVLKAAKLKKELGVEPHLLRQEWLNAGYLEVPVTGGHVIAVARLPRLHDDPFDRLLIAQAAVEDATLLTADPVVGRYGKPVQLIR